MASAQHQRMLRQDAAANRERLLTAAITAFQRQGAGVPMADIAAAAGVGVGTLYRHFGGRDELLDALTVRSFELVLVCVRASDQPQLTGREGLGLFFAGTVGHRDQLVLPLGGGPTRLGLAARSARKRVHAALQKIVDRGVADGSVRADATTWDVIAFGALLAQPLSAVADWPRVAGRLADVYLDGLRPDRD